MTDIATGEYDATFVFKGDVGRLVDFLRSGGYGVSTGTNLSEINHSIFTVREDHPKAGRLVDFEMTPESLQLVVNGTNESTERSRV